MQTANIMLALAGDQGNTIPKFGVTAAEIAVLRTIHGEGAVYDVEPAGDVERSNREELERLRANYHTATVTTSEGQRNVVGQLFPGIAARVFTSLDELELPEEFYKATARVKPVKPAKHRAEIEPGPDSVPTPDDEEPVKKLRGKTVQTHEPEIEDMPDVSHKGDPRRSGMSDEAFEKVEDSTKAKPRRKGDPDFG